MQIDGGLEVDSYGSVQTEGSTPSLPTNLLYGSQGLVGIGTNLYIDNEGNFAVD